MLFSQIRHLPLISGYQVNIMATTKGLVQPLLISLLVEAGAALSRYSNSNPPPGAQFHS